MTLLRPWKCDLLSYLTNHMDMNIKVERKEWNDSNSEDENSLDTTRDVVVEETISDYEKLSIADTSKKSLSETYVQDVTLNEDMLSGNLESELLNKPEDKQTSDSESLSSVDTNILNKHLICSTPQLQSEEEDSFLSYKQLIIPQETKYIELILCCNKDPITSFAQLAKNDDNMFSNVST